MGNENVNETSKIFWTHFAAQASSRLVCYVCSDLALLLALVLPLPHYSFRKELGYQDYLSKTALNHREIKFDNQIGSYSCQDPYFVNCTIYQDWRNILGQRRRIPTYYWQIHTANVYRDLQGLYGVIGVQGFQIYGIACIPTIPVIFEVNKKKCGLFIYTLY